MTKTNELLEIIVKAGYRRECVQVSSIEKIGKEIHFFTGTTFYNGSLWNANDHQVIVDDAEAYGEQQHADWMDDQALYSDLRKGW